MLFSLLMTDPYFIAIKKNEGAPLESLHSFTPLLPPQGHFYADPMLFKHYLFFEDYAVTKGLIAYVILNGDHISERKVALELPTHLSFPHVFEVQGEIYMTPETYDERAISLFKADPFPDHWVRVRTLVRGEHFSDPMIFHHNGYYWLFTSVHMDQLRIYFSESLEGPFHPHPINRRKVKGRNAGSIFSLEGRLIRPVQDCRISYGKSMILKEIIELNPVQFSEREIGQILPNWAPHLDGTHTYNQNDDYVVYDGRLEKEP